eukprot:CAMPEP_0172674052 /NCGR_PEP_ID=MMETSP1074-20121228/12523_1 /TAXON_ID=2916 /ORGANISM="Ceratium fusus, Strain PA161109" /LENGTH=731 /DNA_ID=CAMNT_0013491435 /DNA_START=37 /DNA_END=2232 /DNA_ORIENTATION=-
MSGLGLHLKAATLTENRLALTNKVYVCAADAGKWTQNTDPNNMYVDIKGCIFSLEVNAKVEVGTIGLSKVHREYARISTGQEILVRQFLPPPAYDLGSVKLEVDYFAKPAPDARRVEVKDEDLEALFRERFKAQVLATQQWLALDYEGSMLKFTVIGLQPVDLGKGAAKTVNVGMLSTVTELEFQQGPSGKLHVLSNKVQQRSIFRPDFNFEELGIGGLSAEFGNIFRRAFAARTFPPQVIRDLGIHHVRGMLLHGPPGTGKTLIARQLAKFLKAAEPKIVNGPEILNKYVGQAEENIRALFADAEREEKQQGENSQLHVVIFDEIDSICKTRGSKNDGTGVHDSIVNQLLSKIDGVDSLNNILLIGMTNRIDLIDEALLRPGRLEVHVEISLPDENGRQEILNIHTKGMRETGYLQPDVSIPALAGQTKNFSGAEIAGLIRSATSFALNRKVNIQDLGKTGDLGEIKITNEDFELALEEVKPAFGVHADEFDNCIRHGMIAYSRDYEGALRSCKSLVDQVRCSQNTPLLTLLLHGPTGCGKTALASHLARTSDYPFVRRITAENYVGYSEQAKVNAIAKIFEDAYKSPLSFIVLDDLERIMDYVRVGPRFGNVVLQALFAMLKRQPPKEHHRLLVIGTSSEPGFLEEVELFRAFNVAIRVPMLSAPEHFKLVLSKLPGFTAEAVQEISVAVQGQQIGIRTLLLIAEMAVNRQNPVQREVFLECLQQCGSA